MADNTYRFRRLKWGAPPRLGTGLPPVRAARARGEWLNWLGIVAFAFVVSSLGFAWLLGGLDEPATGRATLETATLAHEAQFGWCAGGRGVTCVIDGDTFRYRDQSIRIADIDTPETRNYGCAAEKALGDRATARLVALLNAGPFLLEAYERDTDVYGRKLRIVTRGGQSLGMVLVAEGLARRWDGARRPWC